MSIVRDKSLRYPSDLWLARVAGPYEAVVFAVTCDLSRSKLLPAIYDLANRGLRPPGFSLVSFGAGRARTASMMRESVQQHARWPTAAS